MHASAAAAVRPRSRQEVWSDNRLAPGAAKQRSCMAETGHAEHPAYVGSTVFDPGSQTVTDARGAKCLSLEHARKRASSGKSREHLQASKTRVQLLHTHTSLTSAVSMGVRSASMRCHMNPSVTSFSSSVTASTLFGSSVSRVDLKQSVSAPVQMIVTHEYLAFKHTACKAGEGVCLAVGAAVS